MRAEERQNVKACVPRPLPQAALQPGLGLTPISRSFHARLEAEHGWTAQQIEWYDRNRNHEHVPEAALDDDADGASSPSYPALPSPFHGTCADFDAYCSQPGTPSAT